MNKYIIAVILVPIIYFACSLLLSNMWTDEESNTIKKAKNKRKGANNREVRYSTSSIKKQLEKALSDKADASKKYKIETMCLQAGYELSYGEFKIISFAVALALPLLMLAIMHNIYLGILFAFIGYKIPAQYLKTMANNRILKMEKQVGSFLRILLERYKSNRDMSQSLCDSLSDFQGLEPFYSILKKGVAEVELGYPLEDVFDGLGRKSGNKYLIRFADYYKMTPEIATHKAKVELLNQSLEQYNEDRELKFTLKEKINGPVREAYIMVCATPIFMVYQSFASDGYLDFMINTPVGQAGLAGTLAVLLACIWFINAKIGAPIE